MARDFNAKNIIVGAATVYVGPANAAENDRINVSAADATAQDPTKVVNGPSASWYHMGYTMEGVTLNIEPTYNEVMVDQLLDVARLFKTSQSVTVATSLTEATLENLYVAIGGQTGAKGDYQTASPNLDYNNIVNADGTTTTSSATAAVSVSGVAASAQAHNILHLNGGALGISPVERSVCFVGSAPTSVAENGPTGKAERVYILYRAVSVDAVGVGVRRDDATVFPVNFRVMPSEANAAPDGNAAYGKIIDRIF